MGSIVGKFVAVRMIVLDYGETNDPAGRRAMRLDFENWMIGAFLNEMGRSFKPSLERITFLRGNKRERNETDPLGDKPVQSYQNADSGTSVPPEESTDAGANADFAWITYWTDREANREAWRSHRSDQWYDLWAQFRSRCQKKSQGRPKHGPAFDAVGGPAAPGEAHAQFGAGAGCLVEGFEVVYDEAGW